MSITAGRPEVLPPLPVRGWKGVLVLDPPKSTPAPILSSLSKECIWHNFKSNTSLLFSFYTMDLFLFGSFPWGETCLFCHFTAEFPEFWILLRLQLENNTFYPFKYWLVPCSPRTSSGKLLTLITTSPKTSTFPFQCHCKWIPHLGSPFQQHQCCLSCTNVLWVVFSPCRSSNKFQVVTKLVLLWGNSNCTNRNPQRIFHLVAVSYNKWFAVAPLWVQLSVVQVGCAVEPEDWVNRAGFGSRQFTLRTLHMVTEVKYYS